MAQGRGRGQARGKWKGQCEEGRGSKGEKAIKGSGAGGGNASERAKAREDVQRARVRGPEDEHLPSMNLAWSFYVLDLVFITCRAPAFGSSLGVFLDSSLLPPFLSLPVLLSPLRPPLSARSGPLPAISPSLVGKRAIP